MTSDPFALPRPFPQAAVFLGPSAWLAGLERLDDQTVLAAAPGEVLATLRRETADADAATARLLVVHQDAFAGPAGGDALEGWLGDVTALRGPHVPVLLHAGLDGGRLVRFFRAGLFDALAAPVERMEWVNMLIRAERRLEIRQQGRLVLAAAGETQQVLQDLRRRLVREAAGATDELLVAQENLEAANRRLSDAMAELSLLYRFGRRLSTARNWDDTLREILRNLADFVGAGGAALVLRSAAEGPFSPRQTWQWDEHSWDRVLVDLQDQVDGAVAESIMAPGVFRIDPARPSAAEGPRRIIAQPLEHQGSCLGYLLLLFGSRAARDTAAERFLPFLQAVQLVLAEEVAGAQLLDRIRDIGVFNARVLETVRSAIWVLSREGRTVFVNRAGRRLLTGHESAPVTAADFLFRIGRGRDLPETQPAEEPPELLLDGRLVLDHHEGTVLAHLRDRAGGAFRGEGVVVDAGGQRVPVMIETGTMPGRGRDENWLVVVAEDLRDARILEAERLRADRLEGLVEMSATLAHEIRNPLMGLSAQAELLAERLPGDDPRRRYLDVMTREVGRINDTITRMLNFVRPYEPVRADTDLDLLAGDAVTLARSRAAERGVVLEHRPVAGGARLRGDAAQLKQVVLNLVLNGIDAAPPGGSVAVAVWAAEGLELADTSRGTRQRRPGLVCEVRDTGPGVPDEDRDRIFRPFHTTKSSGTGLGLSICHKIVAAHGGEITVGRDGDETVFRVALPTERFANDATLEEEAR
jgi:signal transduction histidine kinase